MKKKKIIIIIIIVLVLIGLIALNSFTDLFKVDISNTTTTSTTSVATTITTTKKYIVIDIEGEIKSPGIYKIEEGLVLFDVLEIAGGLTYHANISNMNKAQEIYNNAYIYISSEYMESYISYDGEKSTKSELININTASIDELTSLNGIGESIAERIVNYRNEYGNFECIEDIKNVKGIGDSLFEKIKDYITV